jgi:hypothetical protein
VCAPCFDPTQPSPQPATGACSLACDSPQEGPLEISCPYSGPNLIDPTQFTSCESATCQNAHCLPADRVPPSQQGLLAACPGGGFCAPDTIIGSLNNFVPKTCASLGGVEGRCVSTCLPSVAAQADLLPTTGCDAGEVCAPCYDPTSPNWMIPTGACSIGCDSPKSSPAPIVCPYNGPPLVNPSPFPSCASSTCSNAHCVPATLIPPAQRSLLSVCPGGGFCTPDKIIETANNFVPAKCTSIAGVEGRCVSTCLPSVEAEALVLPTAGCAAGEVCAPCYDPTVPSPAPPTGACSIGCDMPGPSPAPIACPYSGPNIINPTVFPSCASATCSGAHCLPASLVPPAQQALLKPCSGGGFCAPDPIIGSANHFVPPKCTSIAGAEGRCISTCLPSVAAIAAILPTAGCAAGTVCAPCYDPTSAKPTVQTGACSLGCDAPTKPPLMLTCPWPEPSPSPPVINPTALPGCGCTGAHCLPASVVPSADRPNLNTCSDPGFGAGFCTPDQIIATGGNFKPPGCAPFANVTNSTQGRCLSGCLKTVQSNPTLETSTCSGSDKCAPCWDPFTGLATGACSLSSCDSPPPVFTFPKCCNFVGNGNIGTCAPLSQLSAQQQGALPQDTCAGNYLCAPNEWLPGHTPMTCTTGLGFSGACVPRCINNNILFGQGSCPTNDFKCIACFLAPAGTPGC